MNEMWKEDLQKQASATNWIDWNIICSKSHLQR